MWTASSFNIFFYYMHIVKWIYYFKYEQKNALLLRSFVYGLFVITQLNNFTQIYTNTKFDDETKNSVRSHRIHERLSAPRGCLLLEKSINKSHKSNKSRNSFFKYTKISVITSVRNYLQTCYLTLKFCMSQWIDLNFFGFNKVSTPSVRTNDVFLLFNTSQLTHWIVHRISQSLLQIVNPFTIF